MATAPTPYTPPSLCIGSWTITNDCTKADTKTMESYVAESLEIAGAPINVFKLLGVHEQGRLIDLTGNGFPISSGSASGSDIINAFDITASSWKSVQTGPSVVTTPAFIGYDFGIKKTSNGVQRYDPSMRYVQHISTLRIQQGPLTKNRVLQVRVERSVGNIIPTVSFTGTGNGKLSNYLDQPIIGYAPKESTVIVTAISPTSFSIMSSVDGPLGTVNIGQPYANESVRFSITQGSVPFVIGDMFIIKLQLDWRRVDVVNLPDTPNLETIQLRASSPAPFWRIVPLLFNGAAGDPWEVVKLEMHDYQSTSITNIQDTLFLENRDRDYAHTSIMLKCQYQPFDNIGDVGKFGFSILDQYIFTCSFARMVELLGRPLIVGDIVEVTPEVQYDQNLMPVKRYLEITDVGWSAEGFTPQWQPILYRFQAVQLLPSVEVRDISKPAEEIMFRVDDGEFFDKITTIQTRPINTSDTLAAQATDMVPSRGSDSQSVAVVPEMPKISQPQTGMYVEDGLPPNNLPYTEGYKLPDVTTVADGEYFRLNYPEDMRVPARLYKFSLLKNRWIYVETDTRDSYSSHKPSVRNALISLTKKSLQDPL